MVRTVRTAYPTHQQLAARHKQPIMLQYSRSPSCHRIGGPAAMGVLGPVCPASARPCTLIPASAPACSTRTTTCYALSSTSNMPFRQVRARPMALPLSAGKGQGFSAQPSKGAAGGKGPQGGSESPSAMADKLFKQKGAPEPFLGPVFTVKSPGACCPCKRSRMMVMLCWVG